MTSTEIKERLTKDVNLLIKILEDNFTNVKIYGEEIRMSFNEDSSPNGTVVYLSNLYCRYFSKGLSGDIYMLLQEKRGQDFKSIHKYLNSFFDDNIDLNKTVRKSLFGGFFEKYIGLKQNDIIYKDSELDKYGLRGNVRFFEDNITFETQVKFQLGYDYQNHRITIPWRNMEGDLIGITSRNNNDLVDNYKYLATLPFIKTNNLYGFYENYNYILSTKKVIIVEAEKSVLQAHSFGVRNIVAVGCHSLSNQQIELLKYNVDMITLMFDSDVEEDEVIEQCKKIKSKLSNKKICYCIDRKKLLKEKSSPTDFGKDVFLEVCKQIKEYKGDNNE